MKVNNKNRYYCHRKLSLGRVNAQLKTIHVPYNAELTCVYLLRLRDTYHYVIQLEIV